MQQASRLAGPGHHELVVVVVVLLLLMVVVVVVEVRTLQGAGCHKL